MGKIVVAEFVSMDGVMEAPGGEEGYKHTGWATKYIDEEQFKYKQDELFEHEALLMGRKTYQSFAGAWPARPGEFADRMNSMPKFVASTTLQRPEWNNTTVLEGDAMSAAAKIKAERVGDILIYGSRSLVNALRQHNLVDEYRLMVFPIILGSGKRLFDDSEDAADFNLVDSHPLGNGAIVLTYRPAQAPLVGRELEDWFPRSEGQPKAG